MMGTDEHKKNAPKKVPVGVISVSTTRNEATDESGNWIKKQAVKEGHEIVFYRVVRDDIYAVKEAVRSALLERAPRAILITGGTGIGGRDVTIEAVRPMFEKELTAFGVIFSQLSFEEINSAAILSRATAGVIGGAIVFCMPGSLKACKLACNELIFPELGHLVKHLSEG